LYNKAIAEDDLGQKQNAILSYKRLVELAPAHYAEYAEYIEYARKRLRELEGR
jgi:hypothetical protein